MPRAHPPSPHPSSAAIARLRARIARFDLVCSGTLLRRTKVCGKPGCRCARDPKARHGPYYEWSRREVDRLVHSVVSPAEARLLSRAIRNHRAIRRLLQAWQEQSLRVIRSSRQPPPGREDPGK